jgi:hypothetical protein
MALTGGKEEKGWKEESYKLRVKGKDDRNCEVSVSDSGAGEDSCLLEC